jgi:hypothetical protein
VSARPSIILDSELHLCDLRLVVISIFAIELLVLLVLACSSIACRTSALVARCCAPQDRDGHWRWCIGCYGAASLEGCSWAGNVVSIHQSSYPTSLIERSGTTQLVDRDDVHGPTTAFQGCCALATDTPPPIAAAIVWSATPGH